MPKGYLANTAALRAQLSSNCHATGLPHTLYCGIKNKENAMKNEIENAASETPKDPHDGLGLEALGEKRVEELGTGLAAVQSGCPVARADWLARLEQANAERSEHQKLR
jgi:hypothetical protein